MTDGGYTATSEQMLRGLARELKQPLTYIARRAELSLADAANAEPLAAIESSAEEALRLIDSFLLSAQSEYGQQLLPLTPLGLGSIIYDVAHALVPAAKKRDCVIEAHVGHTGPVMAHAQGLRAALHCLASQILLCEPGEKSRRTVRLSTYRHRSGDYVAGVFDPSITLSRADITKARTLQGSAHMALAQRSGGSGVQLAIAETLAQSVGARLDVVRHRRVTGFGLKLIKSEQLQLV